METFGNDPNVANVTRPLGVADPQIGARHRGRPSLRYRSSVELFGLPVVSVAIGPDAATGQSWGRARGVIAIGDQAVGVVAVGGVSLGVVSMGGASAGLYSVGGAALGLFCAIGGGAFAPMGMAVGGGAAGVLAVGAGAGGFAAIGVGAAGMYAAGIAALGAHTIDGRGPSSDKAVEFFTSLEPLVPPVASTEQLTPEVILRPVFLGLGGWTASTILVLTLIGVLALLYGRRSTR